jgi:type I restriction enzyme S subunit
MDALPEHARQFSRIDRREFTGSGARFKNRDTLLARITPCLENGKTAFVTGLADGEIAHGSTEYIVISGKEGVSDDLFAYYLARLPNFRSHVIASMEGTSGRQRVPNEAVSRFELRLPSLGEQRAIAHILGTLDDKIELNRRMNETLEAMARAIFKSWFVDFDPVRAKASGEPPESICRRLGLTPDVLAQFPDSFQDSELGEIPARWDVGTIADHCGLNEKSWTAKNLPDELRYVDLTNAKSGVISEVQMFASADAPSRARRMLRAGDTILGTVRPGNRSYALIGKGLQLTGSTGFAVLTPKRKKLREFVYLAATDDENIDRLSRLADGAAYPAVRPDVVTCGPCVVPSDEVIDAFHQATASLVDNQAGNTIADATLVALRDTLLPKLLSGSLPARSAEREAATV